MNNRLAIAVVTLMSVLCNEQNKQQQNTSNNARLKNKLQRPCSNSINPRQKPSLLLKQRSHSFQYSALNSVRFSRHKFSNMVEGDVTAQKETLKVETLLECICNNKNTSSIYILESELVTASPNSGNLTLSNLIKKCSRNYVKDSKKLKNAFLIQSNIRDPVTSSQFIEMLCKKFQLVSGRYNVYEGKVCQTISSNRKQKMNPMMSV